MFWVGLGHFKDSSVQACDVSLFPFDGGQLGPFQSGIAQYNVVRGGGAKAVMKSISGVCKRGIV